MSNSLIDFLNQLPQAILLLLSTNTSKASLKKLETVTKLNIYFFVIHRIGNIFTEL